MIKQPRYIDATQLEEVFENLVRSWRGTFSGPAYADALQRLKDAPTVNVTPVKNDCADCGGASTCQHNRTQHGLVRVNCPLWRAQKGG